MNFAKCFIFMALMVHNSDGGSPRKHWIKADAERRKSRDPAFFNMEDQDKVIGNYHNADDPLPAPPLGVPTGAVEKTAAGDEGAQLVQEEEEMVLEVLKEFRQKHDEI